MSDDLPQRPVDPLAPPPGHFDVVLAAATHRRMRRLTTVLTVAGVFLAGIAGGFALDQPATRVPTALVELAGGGGDDSGGGEPAESPRNSASVTREEEPAPAPKSPQPTTDEPPAPSPSESTDLTLTESLPAGPVAVNGVALGVAGQPASGLYVYPGVRGAKGFVPAEEPVGRTAEDGTFSLSCPGTPVLLTPWLLNEPAGQQAATATWAATFVGGVTDSRSALAAPCSTDGSVTRTIVQPGSTVSGVAEIPAGCGAEGTSLRLWLYNERAVTVRVGGLEDGDEYRIGGLPPGQHTLAAHGSRSTVTVGGGETLAQDVTFGCDVPAQSPPPPSPEPSGSPSPSDTPSPPESEPSPSSPSASPALGYVKPRP